jgi:AraC family transcriptional regulator
MADCRHGADQKQALAPGSFYGEVQAKLERCDAIFTDVSHRSARKLPSHSHELPFFGVVLDGQYGERYGRQELQFQPFTIMFRPAGIPHQDEIGPRGVKFFEIELRPGWRKRLNEDEDEGECGGFLDRAFEDRSGGPALWLGMKLHRELHSVTIDELIVESLLTELVACVANPPNTRAQKRPAWLKRVLEKIAADYSDRLTLEELSREAGVHPVHLSRVFRKWNGQGIGEYVHRLRIRSACEQMLKVETPIAEIGLAAGFADQSHFTRSFRRITGVSPARFQSMVAERRHVMPFLG